MKEEGESLGREKLRFVDGDSPDEEVKVE